MDLDLVQKSSTENRNVNKTLIRIIEMVSMHIKFLYFKTRLNFLLNKFEVYEF